MFLRCTKPKIKKCVLDFELETVVNIFYYSTFSTVLQLKNEKIVFLTLYFAVAFAHFEIDDKMELLDNLSI